MKKTGIITALKSEAACLTAATVLPNQPIEITPDILLVLSGMGQARAQKATEQLIDAKVDSVISFGTAGGLDKEIKPGELCIPQKIIMANAIELQTDSQWHSDTLILLQNAPVKLHSAPLFSSDKLVSSTDEKKIINKHTKAIAIDMESAAILETANKKHLPCLVLRAIVDSIDMQLPASAIRHTDHFGKAKLLPLLGDLLAHPSQIFPIIKLATCFNTATSTLKWTAKKIT